ncbi:M4 family metallopeptidase [Methylomicrobium lacus]|uniref:M4 family metallopeptidase n=1 Tax=Methylomicrobium lacus TaxID=136992 RepID=UPI00045E93ED|nr:M4 family metallopeptidase [Methylomicrobium lacus]
MKLKKLFVSMMITLTTGYATAAWAVSNHDPVKRALGHIKAHGQAVEKSSGDQFFVRDVIVDRDGGQHVRFDRTYKGLNVIGGDVVVHSRGNGAFISASHTLKHAIDVDTQAHVDETDAIDLAEMEFDATGIRNASSISKLVVYTRDEDPVLAWDVKVLGSKDDGTPAEVHYIIGANAPQLLDHWDDIETSSSDGNGDSFFNGTVAVTTDYSSSSNSYSLRDPSRGNQYTVDMKNKQGGSGSLFADADNAWGNFLLTDRATVGVDAQYGTAMTWDYFKNVHGRTGIANDGKGAFNRVHYGRNYNNAFWSDGCFCMTYGDGDGTTFNPFDSLDVAGHEMSHGVTSRTANLTYSGESGGLNEATSDIFGTMVEYYANNAQDRPDYLIGEKLYKSGTKALRYMHNPSLDGRSASCWSSSVGSLDVHYSSGVANHFFYLLAEGSAAIPASPTCNGSSVTGIGRDAAQRIWYRALTVYMTSSTNYAGARAATLAAAGDLFGLESAEKATVAAAWSAVNVN